MRTALAVGIVFTSLVGATGATGATGKAVPPFIQGLVSARSPALAYVPTRIPIGYRYARFMARPEVVRQRFRNRAGKEVVVVVASQQGACEAGRQKTFQLAGNRVFWAQGATEQQAWRCVVRGARTVRLVAATSQPPTRFADVGLGTIVASVARIR